MASTAERRGDGPHVGPILSRAHAVITAPIAVVPNYAKRILHGEAFADLTSQDRALDRRNDGSVKVDQHRLRRQFAHELVFKLAAQAMLVDFHGAVVPSVQSAVLTSQIGERLSVEHPFCVIWHDRDGRRFYGMRSREDGTDVGAIAASFGGGGHTHAAGFSVSLGPDGSLPDNPALPRSVIDRRRPPSQ